MKIAIAGCGNIAKAYLDCIAEKDCLEVCGLFDLDKEKAMELSQGKYHLYDSIQDILADKNVEWLVNLTPPKVHYSVIKEALEAGLKVYSEKPLCLDLVKSKELAGLSKKFGLPLVCAPITYLGEAQQAVMKEVISGKLGDLRFAMGEMHNGFIESWHPAPEPFYQIGPLWDVGLYILMHMLHSLGKVKRVQAQGSFVRPNREDLEGHSFKIGKPDFIHCLLEFHSGAHGRLATSFVVPGQRSQYGALEYHGSKGSVHVDSPILFDSPVDYRPDGDFPAQSIELTDPYQGIDWARGLELLATEQGVPEILSLDMTIHGLEVLHAIEESYEKSCWIELP